VAEERLLNDNTLSKRTPLTVERVLQLLKFCLNTTYFMYNGLYYKQTQGAAMGSPVSPIVANLYMESFEERALRTAPNPPYLWLRYVDDTFVSIHEYNIDSFTNHINGIDPHIKFTMEPEVDGKLAFLDTYVIVTEDGTIKTTVYRKPTHTDQYLSFESNHHLQHKRSVVRSLMHRVDTIVTEEEDQEIEQRHVHAVLKDNGYTDWMLKIPEHQPKQPTQDKNTNTSVRPKSFPIPYIHGMSENLAKIYEKYGVHTYFKPYNTGM
jgi:hypothetical protein